MTPDSRFRDLNKEFWAHVRLISQHVGYSAKTPSAIRGARRSSQSKRKKGEGSLVKVPAPAEIIDTFLKLELNSNHLFDRAGRPTSLGRSLLDYYEYRASVLNEVVVPNLMDKDRARREFLRLKKRLRPTCPIPMNKQKGDKRAPAFLTGIVNMLIEAHAGGLPCDYDPRELTVVTRNGRPFRTLARRVDGAFPGPVDPLAVWEIKEYYYTTTFGSRVADGVYESLLDGLELEELRTQGVDVKHYLFLDDRFTWWDCGRSYLCRVIDMLHMGYVDEVLFGAEVLTRLPEIVAEWVTLASKRA